MKYFILSFIFSATFVGAQQFDNDLVSIQHVEFNGYERFPDVIDVFFHSQGNVVHLNLHRDDEATDMLSEDIFEVSRILPSGLFEDEQSYNFAAYDSGNSNIVVVHREAENANPKFYGRFAHNNETLLIHSEDGSHEVHRVRRDTADDHHVHRRSSNDNILELFIFADLSVFNHFKNEVVGGTTEEVKLSVKEYLNAIAKEVDLIYLQPSPIHFRVYLQQYQVMTNSNHQSWVGNNTNGTTLQSAAVTDLQAYYNTLRTKFDFPYPDHLMGITRLQLEGSVQVMYNSVVCGDPLYATSIATMQAAPYSMAQGIALTLELTFDDAIDGCYSEYMNIMSTNYFNPDAVGVQGNRWNFSECSAIEFQAALGGGMNLTCLSTEDVIYDFVSYEESSFLGELYTRDEQCVLINSNGSTFCDESLSDIVDCYSITQGCLVSGVCEPHMVAQFTPCGVTGNLLCGYGYCDIKVEGTSSSSSLATTTVPVDKQTTTTAPPRTSSPTTPDDCVIETGFVEFDLPGCGCCGGCGCDEECSECDPGLPSESQSDECTKLPDCCAAKVRVTTLFVPAGCNMNYVEGPTTIITEKRGWDDTDTGVTAEVYRDGDSNWQVQLVPKDY